MKLQAESHPRSRRLPAAFRWLFWEYDFAGLRWPDDQELIIEKILTRGDAPAVRWLRRRLDDAQLRAWIEARRGRGLSPRHLRFWALLLGIPARRVTHWLRSPARAVWDNRVRR